MSDKRALGVPRGVPPRPYRRGKNVPWLFFPVFFQTQRGIYSASQCDFPRPILRSVPVKVWAYQGRREAILQRASDCTKVCANAVDSHSYWPYAGLMELHVPPELEAKLTRMAAESGRTADQVALDLLANSVDHGDWFRAEVEKGRAAAREGRLIEHDDVAARMDRRYRG